MHTAPLRRVRIAVLGCKVNGVEASSLGTALVDAGLTRCAGGEQADLLVVQSCTVTGRADRDTLRLVRRLRRESPNARLVVTGCLARRDPGALAALPEVDLVAGSPSPGDLVAFARGLPTLSEFSEPPALPQVQRDPGHTRAFLKIQDGCARRCAFCIVPSVRGGERSAAPEEVEAQVRALAAAGFGEVVLSGIHLAAFGRGAGGLLGLLRRLEADPPACRVRLSSLEPMEAGEALVAHVASSRVVVPHLHLPLQSGSDAVLRRMRRGITVARFLRLAASARSACPRLHLATDLIAGFPGETEAEHEESCALARELGAGSLHVFPFSPRSGTAAAGMPGRLPPSVIATRAARLRELGALAAAAFAARANGTTADVLALRRGRGLTDNYLDVRLGAGSPGPGTRFSAFLRRDAEGSRLVAWPVYNPPRGDIDSAAPNP